MIYKIFSKQSQKDLKEIAKITELCNLNPMGLNDFQTMLDSPVVHCLIIALPFISKKVLGYVLYWVVPPEVEIYDIVVHPCFQGIGLGSALLRKVFSLSRTSNVNKIYLEVRRSNIKAIKFYEKHGFKTTWIRKKYYSNNKEDALIMCCFLK